MFCLHINPCVIVHFGAAVRQIRSGERLFMLCSCLLSEYGLLNVSDGVKTVDKLVIILVHLLGN